VCVTEWTMAKESSFGDREMRVEARKTKDNILEESEAFFAVVFYGPAAPYHRNVLLGYISPRYIFFICTGSLTMLARRGVRGVELRRFCILYTCFIIIQIYVGTVGVFLKGEGSNRLNTHLEQTYAQTNTQIRHWQFICHTNRQS
jgi:hypothetical protein